MNSIPRFPEFKILGLEDRGVLNPVLKSFQPHTSELTFTNLFIWRHHYRLRWSLLDQFLIVAGKTRYGWYVLEPVGEGPRAGVVTTVLEWLRQNDGPDASIERAGATLASELRDTNSFVVEPQRDHFDYLYNSADLAQLSGRHFHAKRNHVSQFTRRYRFEHLHLDNDLIAKCLDLSNRWCQSRGCKENRDLCAEWIATRELLEHYQELGAVGSAILIDNSVEAFSISEQLNESTSVVHLEKANTDLPGSYAAINQLHAREYLSNLPFINREQDLGEPNLRKAKESYRPVEMIEKYRIRLA